MRWELDVIVKNYWTQRLDLGPLTVHGDAVWSSSPAATIIMSLCVALAHQGPLGMWSRLESSLWHPCRAT